MYDILIQQMRDEVKRVGARELRTPEEVDSTLPNAKGTMLVVVNSTCGCAAGAARPALTKALQQAAAPDTIVTVFAGIDKEATARARSYFGNEPPSSPSFAFLRDGKFVKMIHRSSIEGHTSDQVASQLVDAFNQFSAQPERQSA
ncbi:MAG TPA: BrxA/BrxB family bacilliredoxin [Bacteroidota bacterium]